MEKIKIAYIGGGSKMWARIFMNDLALMKDVSGEISLYDIDYEAALVNQKIGNIINKEPDTISTWNYTVYKDIEDALKGSRFVIISILPGTLDEFASDIKTPQKYGIYQAVGDTTGPGGVIRGMRTVPIYESFAKKIEKYCPNAWVLNLTNPMSICTKTLYDVFPKIKAFGCCHEVFHAQEFLSRVLEEELNIKNVDRKDLYTDASGINHFTWITEAKYKDIDLLKLIPSFMEKFYEEGYYENRDFGRFDFKTNSFFYGNKVKMDLYKRYGALAAAGDRHLVEFVNHNWYLSENPLEKWAYSLTTPQKRIELQNERIKETFDIANENIKVNRVLKSSEEAVDLIRAICGLETRVSNVNMPNVGQMPDMPLGSIVETNCVFSNDCVKPVVSNKLPISVKNLVLRSCINVDATYEGIKTRDLNQIFNAFIDQPLCASLSINEAKELFKEMVLNTRKYLDEFYNLDEFFMNF